VVLERLKVYERATRPVLDHYRARPTFRVVNGAQAQDKVAEDVDRMIDDAAAAGRKSGARPVARARGMSARAAE
jgi:hypothetical protein